MQAGQKVLVAKEHSRAPHAQLAELTEEPTEHGGFGLQVLDEAVQNKPTEGVHSLAPHAQEAELTAEPSTTEHVNNLRRTGDATRLL